MVSLLNRLWNKKPNIHRIGMREKVKKDKKEPLKIRKRKGKWIWFLLMISLLFLLCARLIPGFAEYVYVRYIYRWFSQGFSLAIGIFPFSIGECMILIFPIICLVYLVRIGIEWIQGKKNRKDIMIKVLFQIGSTISLLFSCFLLFCGINYYRDSVSNNMGFTLEESTLDELQGLCFFLTEQANQAREEAVTEYDTKFLTEIGFRKLGQMAERSFRKTGETYTNLSGIYAAPKRVFFSRFMSYANITGIFFPFTMEANINIDCTEYTIPATMCHELAHIRGFMKEEEANYIAYLVCKNSDYPQFRYSGYMLALIYSMNQLYEADQNRYIEVKSNYSEGLLEDLREHSEYWAQFDDTIISTISNTMNNTYLKMNNQAEGTKSYGKIVDLLLAEYKAGGMKNE